MIDLKLNELPVAPSPVDAEDDDASLTEAQRAERRVRPRSGLSINDTIAGDALLSVGARGVDVSGVESGAGAGAGSTALTPDAGGSPAPSIVPGSRGTGTTTRSDAAAEQSPTSTTEAVTEPVTESSDIETFEHNEVAARAYECWHERGCPPGSPEVDWHRAVEDLRTRRRSLSASAASA